jgi:putative heme-binding domain-containing protein
MTHQGDAERGKALFNTEQRLACSRCHSVDGKGAKAGPDLFSIGDKLGRRELIESVLFPSATIAVGYSTTIVKTKSGEVLDGVLKDVTDSELTLMGADGKTIVINLNQVEQRRISDISLMPQGLADDLTAAEFADLVEYLASLKLPETATTAHQGMPATIPELPRAVELVPFFNENQKFEHPVWFGPVPGVPGGFAVVEHETGKIWVVEKHGAAETRTLLIDTGRVMTGTRGLLGVVFHPHYSSNRRFYFVKHRAKEGAISTTVFEGEAAGDLKHGSDRPPREVLKIDATSNVHYGGCLQFGPDGMLYIGMGDSGPQQDPRGNAQNLSVLLGKMLRIDVDHPEDGRLYSIPKDNPFLNHPGTRPEIWALGLREPWRFSFDQVTGDLLVGDVGQDLFEEVDIVRRGENYGWNVYEGFQPFSNRYRREGEAYVAPIFAYTRKYGASVTGGFVYRGRKSPGFQGVYIFGDYQTRRLFALTQEQRIVKKVRQIALSPQMIVSFGEDEQHEIFLVGYEGTIYHIDLGQTSFE